MDKYIQEMGPGCQWDAVLFIESILVVISSITLIFLPFISGLAAVWTSILDGIIWWLVPFTFTYMFFASLKKKGIQSSPKFLTFLYGLIPIGFTAFWIFMWRYLLGMYGDRWINVL